MDNVKLNILNKIAVGIPLRTKERMTVLIRFGLLLFIFVPVGTAAAGSENEPNLIDLAMQKYGKEDKLLLFRKLANDGIADYSADKDYTLEAESIAWLCTDLQASKLVTHSGIWVKGAHIKGKLDLAFAKISFPLRFEKCNFTEDINLEQANLYALDFSGTHTHSIDANRLTVEGDVRFCNDFKAEGMVNLVGAKIGGYLNCTGGKFINKTKRGSEHENKAIEATGVKVDGNVSFSYGFESMGTVSLYGATIGRELDCKGGKFTNPGWAAFNGEQMQVNGCVFLSEDFEAKGQVRLIGAKIGRDLDCTNGKFIITDKKATVRKNTEEGFGEALKATGLRVSGNVYLTKGFKAKGMVKLVGAKIDGFLDCSGGEFSNNAKTPNDPVEAIEATRLQVGGNVSMRFDGETKKNFRAYGVVSLYGAKIGGDLDCKRGQFINPEGTALCAEMLEVNQHVFLSDNFHAEGEVRFESAKINGYLFWGNVDSPQDVEELNLRFAKIGMLNIDPNEAEWPNKVLLHGLVYDEINNEFAKHYTRLIGWLHLQYDDPNAIKYFLPQPYEQLATILRKGGQEDNARWILIAKNRDRYNAQSPEPMQSGWVWSRVGPIIDYGYNPLNALRWILVPIALGWILFGVGYWGGLITPESKSAYTERDTRIEEPGDDERKLSDVYPRFNLLIYSLDVFVPLVDLRQASYWLPNANQGKKLTNIKGWILRTGGILRFYMWIHICLGWILSTLLVVGLTGLIRT